MSANLENSTAATGLEKVSFHSNPKERQCQTMFKLQYNCSHASKVMLKILQARLQQYVSEELPDVQAGFRKRQRTRDHWIIEKDSSRKISTSAPLTTLKPLTMWITANCGKFLKRWEYQTTLPLSWETCMQVKEQQLEPDMEQQTDSDWEMSMSRLYIITLLI